MRFAHLWSSLFIKPKKTPKFAIQVCGSEKSFAVAEVQKITANVSQTCGFAVADHPLLFCGICDYGIQFEFAVPSTAKNQEPGFFIRSLLSLRDDLGHFSAKFNSNKARNLPKNSKHCNLIGETRFVFPRIVPRIIFMVFGRKLLKNQK